ncbi:MAG TPA: RidA family protein [Sphingomicrobium sp.]|nr:RidA family protein [Sphingomicrobium sp.]
MLKALVPCSAILLAITSTDAAASGPGIEYHSRPGSRAPFSPAVRVGDLVYASGQIGARPDGTIPVSMDEQAKLAMDHVGEALALAGASFDDVFQCRVMLADMKQWPAFNAVYVRYFKPGRLPARSAFGANGLALGAEVEVECTAYKPLETSR